MVQADAERVFQVLSNLLGNAIKFTPEGGRIEMAAALNRYGCEFFVRDTGPGLTADQAQHVFDRYWQGRVGERGGAGLGLYICRGIVESHGGSIAAASAPGGGALLRFTLPLADVSDSRASLG
jgi:signal transduction histidine kinase